MWGWRADGCLCLRLRCEFVGSGVGWVASVVSVVWGGLRDHYSGHGGAGDLLASRAVNDWIRPFTRRRNPGGGAAVSEGGEGRARPGGLSSVRSRGIRQLAFKGQGRLRQ